jgi:hypothetical protein
MRRSILFLVPCFVLQHASCSVYDESLLSKEGVTGSGGNTPGSGSTGSGGIGQGGGNTGGGLGETGGAGGSGNSGTGGDNPNATYEYTRITDLEETADGRIEMTGGGYWFTAWSGTTACINPNGDGNVLPVPLDPPRSAPEFPSTESNFAMHFVVPTGCPGWGSQGGFGLQEGPTEGSHVAFDASAFTGIAFFAKADSAEKRIRLDVSDVNTHPDGGVCSSNCYQNFQRSLTLTDSWKLYRIPFTNITRAGNPPVISQLYQIIFSFPYAGVASDVWIDDVYFYKEIVN